MFSSLRNSFGKIVLWATLTACFVVPLLIVSIPVSAEGITLSMPEENTAVSFYGLVVVVLIGIIALLLFVLLKVTVGVKDLIPYEFVQAIAGLLVEAAKGTSTPLDDKAAAILQGLTERLATLEKPDIPAMEVAVPFTKEVK